MAGVKYIDGRPQVTLNRKEIAYRYSVEVHTGVNSATGEKLSKEQLAERRGFLSCNGKVEAAKRNSKDRQGRKELQKQKLLTGSKK